MSVEKNRSCRDTGGQRLLVSVTPGFSQVKSGGIAPSRFNGLLSATKPLKRLPIACRQARVNFSHSQSSGVNPNQAIPGSFGVCELAGSLHWRPLRLETCLRSRLRLASARHASRAPEQMLPVVATLLLKMLPLSSLNPNDVTDVATFPTSYTLCQPLRTFAHLRVPMGGGGICSVPSRHISFSPTSPF